MKRNIKRVLCIALALMLCVTISPITAFSETPQSGPNDDELSGGPQSATPMDTGVSESAESDGDDTLAPIEPAAPAASPTSAEDDPDSDESDPKAPEDGLLLEPVAPPPAASPTNAPVVYTRVEPELVKVVSEPLIKIVYNYYDDNSMAGAVLSTHEFYALANQEGHRISIVANNYPGRIPVSTDASCFRVLLNNQEDITALADYNAVTGAVSLPEDYMGHRITIVWFCPVSEITELLVEVVTSVYKNGAFINNTEVITLASNANAISIPFDTSGGLIVAQNGIDLREGTYGMSGGVLNISAPALGGKVSVAAYAPQRRTRAGTTTTVAHTRSSDQVYYGYYTSYYTANGNTAFCLDPNGSGLNSGTYSLNRYLTRGAWPDDLLIKCAYFLYGGPGYNSVKSSLFTNPDSMEAYGLSHAAASYAYLGDNSAFKGLSNSVVSDLIAILNYLKQGAAPPTGFEAYLYNVGSSTSQPLMGWEYGQAPVATGAVEVVKVSGNTEFTGGNSAYSLAGAVFGVYGGGQKLGTITTDANGRGKLDGIKVGLSGLYLTEEKPPAGYVANSNNIAFAISAGQTTSVTVSNKPQNDPIGILLQKQDGDTSSLKPQGNAGLTGAEFTVKFYKELYSTAGQLAGVTPSKTWVLKTNENGAAFLNPSYLVSGDSFYFAGNTDPTLPLGTVTVQETKAPEGYLINNEVFVRQITSSGVTEDVNTYNAPIIADNVFRGGVSIEKRDIALNVKGESQGDATLAGALLDIYNRSGTSVVVGGKSYAPDSVVHTLTTDAAGSAATSNDFLPYGQYEIVERAAPAGYLNTGVLRQSFTIARNGEMISLNADDTVIKNHVIRGGVEVAKLDANLNRQGDPQGDAALDGAVFEIFNRGQNPVLVNGKRFAPGDLVLTLTTDADGWAGTSNDLLPYSTYEIVEKSSPAGYLNAGVIGRTFEIRNDGEIVSLTDGDTAIKNNIIRGGVEICKMDAALNRRVEAQGDATLEDAVFDIFNRGKKSVVVNGAEFAPGALVHSLTTNSDGWAGTASDLLPFSTYEIVERSSPEGYLDTGVLRRTFEIRDDAVIVNLTTEDNAIKNEVIRGGLLIEKWDHETGRREAQGGATLEGAKFEIVNQSQGSVLVQDKLYGVGDVVLSMTTDITGACATPDDLLPFGTYEAREVSPPAGYLAAGILSRTFTIRENGKVVEMNAADTAIRNSPIRGDFSGVKISDGDQKRMPDVPFSITSTTTGESHTLITDKNGEINSTAEWNPHSQDTNRGESSSDGIWFGDIDALDDEVGALLFDTYEIEELPCATNQGMELIKFEMTIDRHNTVVNLGTMTNDHTATPKITTTAIDKETTTGSAHANQATTIVDTVYYGGLIAGKEYTVKGTVMDKGTVAPLLVNGQQVTAERTFKATGASGSIALEFTFDSRALQGKSIVVFESLLYEGKEVAYHKDIADADQTVAFANPKIVTSAAGSEGNKNLSVRSKASIVDAILYDGLLAGETYTLQGVLMDKATGRPLLSSGEEIAASTTFRAQAASGQAKVTFNFSSLDLGGKTAVVFETLLYKAREIAVHADINDSAQTVAFQGLKIGTSAAGIDGKKVIPLMERAVIVDTVSYTGLTPGESYTLQGALMDKATGESLLIDGKEVTATKKFTAAAESGTEEVKFTFNSSGQKGKTVVVYETLIYKGAELAAHTDINDQAQTVSFPAPAIRTSAAGSDGKKVIPLKDKAVIIDTVSYTGLTEGESYTLRGVLMDKASGKPILADNKEISEETKFQASSGSGTAKVEFTFNSALLAGKTVVVFETLSGAGGEIARHTDINDKDQTVSFNALKIITSASGRDGIKVIPLAEKAEIVDVVSYSGLTVGETYKLKGTLMDKAMAKPLLVGDKEITAEAEFKAVAEKGVAQVVFMLNSLSLSGRTAVVFETLTCKGTEIVSHADINDAAQTISFAGISTVPKISTSASAKGGGKTIPLDEKAVVVDKVNYEGLTVGEPYIVKGVLMDQQTGTPVIAHDKEVTSETSFTPKEASGTVEVTFTFDSNAHAGRKLVVFELLECKGKEIAAHKDIKDEAQTVEVSKTPGGGAKTGRDGLPTGLLILAIVSAIGAAALILYLRKRGHEAEDE